MHRLAVLTALATLLLIFAGALVTSTGSGLAVPDWPLSYGQLFPPMVGGVFYEHGHRMTAACVGLLMTALACWIFARERRRWVGRLAACALGAVILQGVLGGITVLFLLPTSVSVIHACLAQAFFGLTVTLAVVTGSSWSSVAEARSSCPGDHLLRTLAVCLTGAVYLQLILGAVMRHTGAGLAIPDFPLAFGRLVPPLATTGVVLNFGHRIWAIAILAMAAWAAARALRRHRNESRLWVPSLAAAGLVGVQITLGAFTVWTGKQVIPTSLHVACGALVLAASLVLALQAHRLAPGRAAGTGSSAAFFALTKPRVVGMILVTTLVGFIMGSRAPLSRINWAVAAVTLLATGLVAAGTLALNQYMERDVDARMRRTQRRPLPAGRLQPQQAQLFGAALASAGLLIVTFGVSPVSGLVTAATVISYLFLYTPLKTRTALCTIVGAFPGALPPVIGWTAAGAELGSGAAALFAILYFWQLPHSLAIAHLYRDDYAAAGVRLLPTVDRDGGSSGRQTVLNCLALLAAGLLPTVLGLAGWAYAAAALALGGWMLWQGVALAASGTAAHARRLLLATYGYIPVALVMMALDRVVP